MLHSAGIDIEFLVCDGATSNRQLYSKILTPGLDSKGLDSSGRFKGHIGINPVTLRPLILVADQAHLIKKLRNAISKSYPGTNFSHCFVVVLYDIKNLTILFSFCCLENGNRSLRVPIAILDGTLIHIEILLFFLTLN